MSQQVGSFIPRGLKTADSAYPARRAGLLLIVLALFIAQVALNYRSFGIKPASDDFPYVNEINRGNQFGPAIFFRQSFTSLSYRPLTSLCIWVAGKVPQDDRPFAIRVLGFIGLAMFMAVAGLWICELKLSSAAALVALLVAGFHPTQPASLGSIDGFNSLIATALLWLGAWMMWRLQDRPLLAFCLTFLCFWLAAGFKEYILGLVPLGVGTVVLLTPRPNWRYVTGMLVMLLACVAALMVVRAHTMPGQTGRGMSYVALRPTQWFENAMLIGVGLLFLGNSIWVYLHQSPAVLAMVGASCLLFVVILAVGILKYLSVHAPSSIPESPEGATGRTKPFSYPSRGRLVLFVLASFALASFPANISIHISEMYLPPVVMSLALLAGLAAEGYRFMPRPLVLAVAAAGLIGLGTSMVATVAKIEGLRNVGDRADRELRQMLDYLGPDAHDVHVALLYREDELVPRATFSVYCMGDENLLVHQVCAEWLRPGKNITLETFIWPSKDFDRSKYDVVLLWDPHTQRFGPANALIGYAN